MNRIGLYTTPESGPTSWDAVRQGVKRVSDSDFRKQFSKHAFTSKKGPGLLSKVKSLFTSGSGNKHAARRHHQFRNPEEGASRPGFITSAPQLDRPGFIAGLSAASADTGAEILQESKSALSKMSLMFIVVGLAWYFTMR
jgi:hypothetical protein